MLTPEVAPDADCAPRDDQHGARTWLGENGWAGARFLVSLFLDLLPIPGRNRPTF